MSKPDMPPPNAMFGIPGLGGLAGAKQPLPPGSEGAGAAASLIGGAIGGAIGAFAAAKGRRSGSQVVLELSPQARAGLDKLVATGLFGRTAEDTAERLLMERMRDLVADGWLEVPERAAKPTPAPARARRKARR